MNSINETKGVLLTCDPSICELITGFSEGKFELWRLDNTHLMIPADESTDEALTFVQEKLLEFQKQNTYESPVNQPKRANKRKRSTTTKSTQQSTTNTEQVVQHKKVTNVVHTEDDGPTDEEMLYLQELMMNENDKFNT